MSAYFFQFDTNMKTILNTVRCQYFIATFLYALYVR